MPRTTPHRPQGPAPSPWSRWLAAGVLIAAAAALPGWARAQAISESFDDISTLAGNGWVMQNNSSPAGLTGWFQGDVGMFSANSGAANAYIAANYDNTSGSGTISNWLLMPNRTLRNGDVLTFYTRMPVGTVFPDRLEVRMSTNGTSTDVGSTAVGVGDFTTLLMSINPTLVTGVYPTTWTQKSITVSGLPAPTSGRFAFRYFVIDGGPSGINSAYIGIDDVAYTPYACPALTVTGTPVTAYAGEAYAGATMAQTGALGTSSFTITAGALPPGLTLSAAGAISGTPTATGTFNFTVTASDASGCSGQKATTIAVAAGKPQQPSNVAATAGNGQAVVSWSPVWTDPYGVATTSYTVTAVQDGTKSCTVTDGISGSCTVTGLTNGTPYTFAVVAHNASAHPDSNASITSAVTPQGPQSITFNPAIIPAQKAGTTLTLGAPGQPVATATSGLAITYTATGACSVAGNVVSFSGAGSCTLTASQAGNPAWAAAAAVQRTFAVQAVVAAPAAIPTLSEWGLMLLSLLAATLGMGALRRRGVQRI